MTQIYTTDVAIIGAGPVGLFAVHQCGMLKMQCHVIDALDHIGGQCAALYPEKPIFDIPSQPEILAGDLIARLKQQAEAFSPVFHTGQQVIDMMDVGEAGWRLTTSQGLEITAKAVLIAAGGGAFGPNRPPLDDIQSFEGTSVFYAVTQKENFRNKKVVIAGGGDSAVDWALALSEVAERVSIVHRRDRFRCAPDCADKLKQLGVDGLVDIITPYQLEGLIGENGQLSSVIVKTMKGESKSIEADILLPFFGLSMDPGPVAMWGLDMDGQYISVRPESMQTSKPGVFAIGDIANYAGKLKLILCGFSEAAMAAHKAFAYVHPGEALHFEFSTTKGIAKSA